jgi:hypothetical protein
MLGHQSFSCGGKNGEGNFLGHRTIHLTIKSRIFLELPLHFIFAIFSKRHHLGEMRWMNFWLCIEDDLKSYCQTSGGC